ncbi:MAG: hypothetical protein KAI47_26955, partial [Deltaproteobacteria bacterium]|nr:hypothetical protein [Deltaproteobacteria bacterium]
MKTREPITSVSIAVALVTAVTLALGSGCTKDSPLLCTDNGVCATKISKGTIAAGLTHCYPEGYCGQPATDGGLDVLGHDGLGHDGPQGEATLGDLTPDTNIGHACVASADTCGAGLSCTDGVCCEKS